MDLSTSKSARVLETTATAPTSLAAEAKPQSQSLPSLPDKPLIVIERSSSGVAIDLRDLWTFRGLLYFLMWRDLKVRYKQTVFGVAWVVLQPLLATLIFTIFLGKLVQVPSDGIPYAIFAYAGLLPWTFFSTAVTNTGNSLVGSAHLITKVYFPRIIIPAAAIGARLVDFAIQFLVLAVMMIYFQIAITRQLLMLPGLVLLITLLALGIGMWASALNVKYRDVGAIMPVMVQLLMYVSPILYPSALVPERWRFLYHLNPLAGIIKAFRASLLGQQFDWTALAISAAITLALFSYATYIFRRMEKSFADLV